MTKKARIFKFAAILFSSLMIFNSSCKKDETTPRKRIGRSVEGLSFTAQTGFLDYFDI